MELGLIVAMDRRGIIGRDGGLPWHLPADLRRFKAITMGKPIIMGRRTYESIGRPLPGRRNIVVSRTAGYSAPGCETVSSFEAALARVADVAEVFVVGGVALYRAALSQVRRIYLTEVHAEVEGETVFPPFDRTAFRELAREEHRADTRHAYDYSFVVLERIRQAR